MGLAYPLQWLCMDHVVGDLCCDLSSLLFSGNTWSQGRQAKDWNRSHWSLHLPCRHHIDKSFWVWAKENPGTMLTCILCCLLCCLLWIGDQCKLHSQSC
jgi:hypothetical protein